MKCELGLVCNRSVACELLLLFIALVTCYRLCYRLSLHYTKCYQTVAYELLLLFIALVTCYRIIDNVSPIATLHLMLSECGL